MKNSEKLQENLEAVDQNLSNETIESISNSIKCLEKICGCGETYEQKLSELKISIMKFKNYQETFQEWKKIYSLMSKKEMM